VTISLLSNGLKAILVLGKHLDVDLRDALEYLDVDEIARHAGRQVRLRLRHRARGAREIGGGRLHDLGDADVGWLQLQQQEQTLEDWHLQPVLAQIKPPGIALLAHDRAGAPIIQQRLVELAEVDLEIEPRRAIARPAGAARRRGKAVRSWPGRAAFRYFR
jgi:hypothetical protein